MSRRSQGPGLPTPNLVPEMSPGLAERFEALLHQWAGQWFPGSRQGELARALRRSAERAGFGTALEDFVTALEGRPDERLRDLVIQEILVGETYFFRDSNLWQSLEREILADLVQRQASLRNLRVWSAGCSTGEEAYSLAMLLRANLPHFEDWTLHLLATDLSEAALERARMAVYRKRSLRELDRQRWQGCFEASGATVRLKDAFRQMVTFKRHNLSAEDFPDPLTNRMDLLLCRNVLIYLERNLVSRIIARFAECLRPGGWLVLAPTEVPLDPPAGLSLFRLRCGSVVLRRLQGTGAPPPEPPPRTTRVARPDPLPLPAAVATPAPLQPAATDRPEATPLPDAADLLARARNAADRGDLVGALARATSCVEANPVSAAGWLVLALVQEEMELWQDSQESLRRALYLEPDLALAHLQMARVQARNGDAGVGRSLANFRKLTEMAEPTRLIPEGSGLTVGQARHLAEQLERTWARQGGSP